MPPRKTERLVDHDVGALAARLERAGGTPGAARQAARRALGHVLHGVPTWDAATLAGLGIGVWAHASLLELTPTPALRLAAAATTPDGTTRALLAAEDGALVEAVLIPGPRRTTLCLSTQVGCARACAFCETGRLGLDCQLSAAEIVDQVRVLREVWRERGASPPLSNLVFMGMGEPFDNLAAVGRSARLLTQIAGFAPSRVTVSTVGVADKLEAFFRDVPAELAVSLNAPDDARRSRIMPVNQRVPMAELRSAILATLPRARKVLFEYVLFDGVNDAPTDADLLADYVRPVRCRVNVIPANPGPDPALHAPPAERVEAFVARLASHGVTTLVRRPRGRDVGGACGQLAGARRLPIAPPQG